MVTIIIPAVPQGNEYVKTDFQNCSDMFGVSAAVGGGFAGLLSIFNMGGRFVWSSVSDYIGRRKPGPAPDMQVPRPKSPLSPILHFHPRHARATVRPSRRTSHAA